MSEQSAPASKASTCVSSPISSYPGTCLCCLLCVFAVLVCVCVCVGYCVLSDCVVFCVLRCVLCVTGSRSAPASQFLPVCVASLLPPLLPSQWLHRLQAGAPILPGIYLWISCLPPLPPPSSPLLPEVMMSPSRPFRAFFTSGEVLVGSVNSSETSLGRN